MKPIGPLMWEHRLIEHMVTIFDHELQNIRQTHQANTEPLLTGIDFFRTYADKTHHGKEEDILFKTLATKKLSPQHRTIMNQLIEDHKTARRTITKLDQAVHHYKNGDEATLATIQSALEDLTALYPCHIKVEDKDFFFPSMNYLSRDEQDTMLKAFHDFDCTMIHEKYTQTVKTLTTELNIKPKPQTQKRTPP
jgi:hemerythrin-like domain-containing protein